MFETRNLSAPLTAVRSTRRGRPRPPGALPGSVRGAVSRLADLPADLASGSTDFGDAAELACAAVKHGTEPPAPFAPLSTEAYREYGADFAVQWAETTVTRLD